MKCMKNPSQHWRCRKLSDFIEFGADQGNVKGLCFMISEMSFCREKCAFSVFLSAGFLWPICINGGS